MARRHPLILASIVVLVLLAACRPLPAIRAIPTPALASPTAAATPIAAEPNQATATPAPGGTPVAAMPAQPPAGVAGEASIGDPYIPEIGSSGYDVQHYTLALDLDPATQQLRATATISATATIANLGRVSLDFIGYRVETVRVDGRPASFYRSENKLYVDLPEPLAEGAPLTIEVDYRGPIQPQASRWAPGSHRLGLQVQEGDHIVVLAEPDGARAWFPSNDHPLDKATFRVEATVPEGLTAVSNGTLVETRPEGDGQTFVWAMDAPMATYLLTLVVDEFERVDGPPFDDVAIRHYVFPEDVARASEALSETGEILDFFSELIAPYPFDEYGHVEVILPGLAMETQTMVMMDRGGLTNVSVMAHEAVHHWYGNSVSPATWADIWLNEGFATYLAALWDTRERGSIEEALGGMERAVLERERQEDDPLGNPDPRFMFGANTYLKGAWVLHMLRQEIGDEQFFATLRTYYERFAGGNARSADFQAVAEEVSGEDLSTFFEQWVFEPGNPEIVATWIAQPSDGGTEVQLQLCQRQDETTFVIPLEFSLAGDGAVQREVTVVDERQERLTVTVPFTPTQLSLDPDQELLAATSVREVEALEPCE